MQARSRAAAAVIALLLATSPALAAKPADPLAGTVRQEGLLPVYVDKAGGRILLQLPPPGPDGVSTRLLYMAQLRTGIGSAPLGLDRSRPGPAQILSIRRMGKKVAFELENPRFRATNAPAPEQAAARDAFAASTLWLGDAIPGPGGSLLVDIAPFLARDAQDVTSDLKGAGEKNWRLAPELTAADPNAVKAFPDNLEFEARQTFVSDSAGPEIRNIAPDPRQISLTVRHSFVRLPEAGYAPRRFDPRGGSFATQVVDFAAPLGSPVVYELANRFRLEKTDPTAARSRVKKPIIFYIDNAAPEPIRTALLEGARWWEKAFEAAGYIDAYKVEILPENVDPLDIRVNVVNWVNRATRGWSYGYAVTDPRTGEILKGTVLLGSLRVRQDMLIFEGLVGADKIGTGGPNDPVQASLARIRQLSAHEVGHALGLLHNFAGSTQDRASVMDYPAPRVGLVNGLPDLTDAYGVGTGRWDAYAIDWLYGTNDDAQARAKADAAAAQGLRFVSDEQARDVGSAHPHGSLWDDGADPVAELARVMAVRRAAVSHFGPQALTPDEPASNLRRKFVPIWLLHRYQVEAAAKLLGGLDSRYAVAGGTGPISAPVPPAEQRAALDALMETLAPSALQVPPGLVPTLSAGWSGERDRQFEIEIFPTNGGTMFEPLAATDAAATVTLDALLHPARLNRLATQHDRNPQVPSPLQLADRLTTLALAPPPSNVSEDVSLRLGTRIIAALLQAQRQPGLSPVVAVQLQGALEQFRTRLAAAPAGTPARQAWKTGLSKLLADRDAIEAFLARPESAPPVPPGMPIGSGDLD
ncbi:DUF5117 domain-containing protein [Sandaracinobacter neustonicus]|uniref:DUF5117 domain-containing protein n=1 Tax=Sandaracinobacter neustonicus TaxID=1715348 RepID=A0A501XNG6_9SPHN|nr:zinc-dependent metalloprotease [Sandaracinobacter neustonicus]TPE62188.1 DUF5117 domain-containing protein [Sandaracinobacter neustonicus]